MRTSVAVGHSGQADAGRLSSVAVQEGWSPWSCVWDYGQVVALRAHCVGTACILRTQRPGYSPKNTCHLTGCTAKQQSPHENDETAFNLVLHCPYEQTTQPCKVACFECFGARGFALGGGDEVSLDSERGEHVVRGLLGDEDREKGEGEGGGDSERGRDILVDGEGGQ